MHFLVEVQHCLDVVREHLTIAKIVGIYYEDHLVNVYWHFYAHAVGQVAEEAQEVLLGHMLKVEIT